MGQAKLKKAGVLAPCLAESIAAEMSDGSVGCIAFHPGIRTQKQASNPCDDWPLLYSWHPADDPSALILSVNRVKVEARVREAVPATDARFGRLADDVMRVLASRAAASIRGFVAANSRPAAIGRAESAGARRPAVDWPEQTADCHGSRAKERDGADKNIVRNHR